MLLLHLVGYNWKELIIRFFSEPKGTLDLCMIISRTTPAANRQDR
jgi:hypothetical protein